MTAVVQWQEQARCLMKIVMLSWGIWSKAGTERRYFTWQERFRDWGTRCSPMSTGDKE